MHSMNGFASQVAVAARVIAMAGTALLFVFALGGCGSDDDNIPTPGPTATRTGTATPSAVPTPTPTPEEPPHTENLFGSTEEGSGALTVDAAAEVHVAFSACIGGTGDECIGGTAIYIATDPGFEQAEEDEPDEPLFVLADGVPVSLEVTAIDEGINLVFGSVTLNAVGESVLFGTTPGLHADLEWQLALPGGDTEGRSVSLKLTTTSSLYTESEVFDVTLVPEHDE